MMFSLSLSLLLSDIFFYIFESMFCMMNCTKKNFIYAQFFQYFFWSSQEREWQRNICEIDEMTQLEMTFAMKIFFKYIFVHVWEQSHNGRSRAFCIIYETLSEEIHRDFSLFHVAIAVSIHFSFSLKSWCDA